MASNPLAENFADLWRSYGADELLLRAESATHDGSDGALLRLCAIVEIGFRAGALEDPNGRVTRLVTHIQRSRGARRSPFWSLLRDFVLRRPDKANEGQLREEEWFAKLVTVDVIFCHHDIATFLDAMDGTEWLEALAVASDHHLLLTAITRPREDRKRAEQLIAAMEDFLLFCQDLVSLIDASSDTRLADAAFLLYREAFGGRRIESITLLSTASFQTMARGAAELDLVPEVIALRRIADREARWGQRNSNYWEFADQRIDQFIREQASANLRASTLETRVDLTDRFVEPTFRDEASDKISYTEFLRTARMGSKRTMVISGEAGSGKTWLMKSIVGTLSSAENDDADPDEPLYFPIYLAIRDLSLEMPTLTAIAQAVGLEVEILEYGLDRMPAVLMLDGLDEVHSSIRHGVGDLLRSLLLRFDGLRCILTTRGLDDEILYDVEAYRVAINPPNLAQLKRIVEDVTKGANPAELQRFLQTPSGSAFRNPLLASTLASLFHRLGALPSRTSDFMDAAIGALFAGQDATKSNFRRTSALDTGEMIQLVGTVCLLMLGDQTYSVNVTTFGNYLSRAAALRASPAPATISSLISELLETGFFIVEDGRVEVIHRSYMEYSAATAAADLLTTPVQVAEVIVSVAPQSELFVERLVSRWGRTSAGIAELRIVLQAASGTPAWLLPLVDSIAAGLPPLTKMENVLAGSTR